MVSKRRFSWKLNISICVSMAYISYSIINNEDNYFKGHVLHNRHGQKQSIH